MNKKLAVIVLIFIIFLALFVSFELPSMTSHSQTIVSTTNTTTGESTSSYLVINGTTETSSIIKSNFKFNSSAALIFFQNLETPTGMLETFNGSKTIYLADDQALDYAAILKLNDTSLASKVNSSIASYGGLYHYWNAVFTLLGDNPSNGWNWNQSRDFSFPKTVDNYTISYTDFNQSGVSLGQYEQYADRALYYSYYCLNTGSYGSAIAAFENANSYFNGYGFADKAYNSSNQYDSYKLAVDLMVYKALMANQNTEFMISSYSSTISQVQNIMSELQGSDGGVLANYEITSSGLLTHTQTNYENGEATSLFVLAE